MIFFHPLHKFNILTKLILTDEAELWHWADQQLSTFITGAKMIRTLHDITMEMSLRYNSDILHSSRTITVIYIIESLLNIHTITITLNKYPAHPKPPRFQAHTSHPSVTIM